MIEVISWPHLRTTNPAELPSASLRLRADGANGFTRVDEAIAVTWKMLMLDKHQFNRVNTPDLMKAVVYEGEKYEDGVVILAIEEVAA